MKRALSMLWNGITVAKHTAGNLLFIVIALFLLVSLFSSDGVHVRDESALILNPSGVIVEQKRLTDPLQEFMSGYDQEAAETLLRDITTTLLHAAEDDRIRVVVLDLSRLRGASMSALEDLGSAVRRFRQSGKPVYAWGDGFTQSQYFVAAHADRIYLNSDAFNPFGGVLLTGVGLYPTFFKSALDTLKIRYHVFKAGIYKGFVEPYTRDDMSPESRVANQALVDVLWTQFRATILRERKLNADALTRYSNEYDRLLAEVDGDSNRLALDSGLVDELVTREGFRDKVLELAAADGETFRSIGYRDYLAATLPPIPVVNPGADKIAVIVASGNIYDGQQPPGAIGSHTMREIIRRARQDDTVKAVVIRIDSPGGSASAAESIRHELELTQQAGKPVVASMAGAAASGGYWIASTANRIYARSTTVTGSIGAFMMFPTFESSLAELGVHTDGVGSTALANAMDPFQPINPVLQGVLEQSITVAYDRFISTVAKGREMTKEAVDEVAQGRVWAGTTAVELGLVDAVGNLDDAIESAALLASVSDYDVIYLEKELSARERLVRQLLDVSLPVVHRVTGGIDLYGDIARRIGLPVSELIELQRSPGIYTQCLYCRIHF